MCVPAGILYICNILFYDCRLIEKSLDKVSMYYDISHGEADIYIFCVLGITDMIQKTMCNNKCKSSLIHAHLVCYIIIVSNSLVEKSK